MDIWPRVLVALTCVVALVASCGGADDESNTPGTDDSVEVSPAESAAAEGTTADSAGTGLPAGFEGLPEGVTYASELIPELADLPLLTPAAFSQGQAFTADEDPRETAVQMVDFLAEPGVVTEFYLAELSGAGYVAESDSFPKTVAELQELADEGIMESRLVFTSPEGIPLQLIIRPIETDGMSVMNVNRFLSGTR